MTTVSDPTVAGWLTLFGTIFSFISVLQLVVVLIRLRRQNDPITITILSPEGERCVLPFKPLRKDVTRAEILGILGVFHGPDFQLPELVSFLCADRISAVQRGEAVSIDIALDAGLDKDRKNGVTAQSTFERIKGIATTCHLSQGSPGGPQR